MAERIRNVTYHHPIENPESGGERFDTIYFNSRIENIIGYGLRRNEAVAAGARRYSSDLPNSLRLKCITPGTTGITAPDLSQITETQDPDNPQTVTDGTAVFEVESIKQADVRPATASRAGVVKIYGGTGNNADGSMTQEAVTEALGDVTIPQVENIVGYGLRRNEVVAEGDRRYSSAIPNYLRLKCVTGGTTGNAAPDFSQITIPKEPSGSGSIGGSNIVDSESTVDFMLGCDENGFYYTVEEEEEGN